MKSLKCFCSVAVCFISLSLLAGSLYAVAQEHPEHPMKHAKVEKPGITAESLSQAITDHVNQEASQKDGYFPFRDDQEKMDLSLTLEKVHKDRLSRLSEDVYFACADFKSTDGHMYDLDIFMKGSSPENLKVTEITLHKKDGKARYNWVEEGEFWRRKFVEE